MNPDESEFSELSRPAGDAARQVLSGHFFGVLSTHSLKFAGYPFGSVVPYCLDYAGTPLILISRLAQHTRNIQENPRLSLLILERAAENRGNVQTDARLTLLGQAVPVAQTDIATCAARYYRHFPDTVGYHTELDFEFYTLQIETLRSISGFGQARWLSPGQVIQPSPFSSEEEARIVDHMNADHGDALLHYHRRAPMDEIGGMDAVQASVEMVAIDAEGMVLRVNQGLRRLPFARPVRSTAQARQMLVEMAQH